MFKELVSRIFGTHSDRELKAITPIVDKIEAMADEYRKLTDDELKAKTAEFKSASARAKLLTIFCRRRLQRYARQPTASSANGRTGSSSSAVSSCIRDVSPR